MAYVYGHYKADTDELFYIGKGTGKRAWVKQSRNPYWHNIVNKHGLTVKIIEDGLTEEEAYNREKVLIEEIGLEKLANLAEGGNGLTSEVAKQVMNRPEVKKKQSEGLKRKWQDESFKEKMTTLRRNQTYTDEWRNQQAEYSRSRFEGDVVAHKKWLENVKLAAQKRAQNDEWMKATAHRNREQAKDPEYRKKVSEGLKRKWAERKLKSKGVADK